MKTWKKAIITTITKDELKTIIIAAADSRLGCELHYK